MLAKVEQGQVIVDLGAMHHATVTMVGVLAEAGVGHDDHFRHRVLADPRHARHQAVFPPGVTAVAIEVVRHAKGHHRLNTGPGVALDFTGQFRLGNPSHSRHAGDRYEIVDFFLDEDRQHQVVEAELGFLEQLAQLRGAPQTAWTGFGELAGHEISWQEANGLDKTKSAGSASLCPSPLLAQMQVTQEFIAKTVTIEPEPRHPLTFIHRSTNLASTPTRVTNPEGYGVSPDV
ncbi:hypothetical protein EMIT0P176_50299 [Pseudomonas sp. IT-P176]